MEKVIQKRVKPERNAAIAIAKFLSLKLRTIFD